MKLIISPENKDLLENPLLLPSLIHLLAQKNALETGLPLYQGPSLTDDELAVIIVYDASLSPEKLSDLTATFDKLLMGFFMMAGETVSIYWEGQE